MTQIVNLSHPLNDKAVERLEQWFPGAKIVTIPVHIDMDTPLFGQLAQLLQTVDEAIDGEFYMILPGLSAVAAYLAAYHQTLENGHALGFIYMKEEGTIFPVFMPSYIIAFPTP